MESLFIFLSNLVLFLALTTLVFSLGACVAMVLGRRKPARRRRQQTGQTLPPLLQRYVPPDGE